MTLSIFRVMKMSLAYMEHFTFKLKHSLAYNVHFTFRLKINFIDYDLF